MTSNSLYLIVASRTKGLKKTHLGKSKIPKTFPTCSHCLNRKHLTKSCFKKNKSTNVIKKKQEKDEKLIEKKEYGLILSNILKNSSKLKTKEKWIGDSGATVHITNNDFGMFNVNEYNFDITVGNQETTRCTKMGDMLLKLKDSLDASSSLSAQNFKKVIRSALKNLADSRLLDGDATKKDLESLLTATKQINSCSTSFFESLLNLTNWIESYLSKKYNVRSSSENDNFSQNTMIHLGKIIRDYASLFKNFNDFSKKTKFCK